MVRWLKLRVTVYGAQPIYQKTFLSWLWCANIYLFSTFFFNRVCPVVKCRVTQHCLYRDSLTLTEWTPSCLIAVRGYIAFFQIFHPQNHFIMVLPFYQNVELGPSSQILLATPLLHIRIFWFHRKQKTFKTRQNSFYEQKVITNIK